MSCDELQSLRPDRWSSRVSIARRRLVVLRRGLPSRPRRITPCFNRPQAISCLATAHPHGADRSDRQCRFNRPQAISCLATSYSSPMVGALSTSFNRPQAISCLATRRQTGRLGGRVQVSIARRRLVVLRLCPVFGQTWVGFRVSIARRRLVVLRQFRATTARAAPLGGFQSPAGD